MKITRKKRRRSDTKVPTKEGRLLKFLRDCYKGMRNGELYALKWEKVDLQKKMMVICLSWNGKNGFKETKSGDDRVVEIADSLMPFMNELYQKRRSEFVPRLESWDKNEQAKVLRSFLDESELPSYNDSP